MTQLIVGAGATGLVAALGLASRGMRLRIVEQRNGPSPLSRAVGILPMSMPILERLGVAEAIRREAVAVTSLAVFDGDRPALRLRLDLLEGRHFRLFCLPQDRTEAILADRLASLGVPVEYGCRFRGLEQVGSGVDVDIDGTVTRHAHVLGADGARSPVRAAIGQHAEGHDLDSAWSIADVDVGRPTRGEFRVMLLEDGNVVFAIPMAERRLRIVATFPDALSRVPIDLGVDNVRRAGDFTIGIRQVPDYRVGRVFLAGDAAHTHSPVGGRGMNLGMADGADWADRLATGRLEGYAAARHAAGAEIIAFTERTRRTIATPDTPVRRAALRALGLAVRVPPVLRAVNRRILLPGYRAAAAT